MRLLYYNASALVVAREVRTVLLILLPLLLERATASDSPVRCLFLALGEPPSRSSHIIGSTMHCTNLTTQ